MCMSQQVKWNEQRVFAGLLALMGWITLIMQFFYTTGSIINFFSFFTIQSNILVTAATTAIALIPPGNKDNFFTRLSVQTAIALYIFIVGLVYNTVLRGMVAHEGWSLFLDTMLHVVIPILYLIYWAIMRSKGTLEYKDGLRWLIFPFLYLTYSLIRGSVVGWYPYPFLNVVENGYPRVFINIAVMIVVFLIAGLLLVAITRFLKKQTASS